jgi:uncharacterized protein (DUF2236 family)
MAEEGVLDREVRGALIPDVGSRGAGSDADGGRDDRDGDVTGGVVGTGDLDGGIFDDSAVIRRVAGEALLLAGGGRAIVLQVAHPAVGQGVAEHSDFAARPMDRLRTTLQYVYAVVFGTRDEAARISAAVRATHDRVSGLGYRANDPELQVWVNATLFDTAVLLYQSVFGALPARDADACYQQYSVLATSIGCPASAWPADRFAFATYWHDMVHSLRIGPSARTIARDLCYPANLPLTLRPLTPLHRFVTIGLLPAPIRHQLGHRWSPRHDRVLTAALATTAAVYPRLPTSLREAPKSYYLADLRRRLGPAAPAATSPVTAW